MKQLLHYITDYVSYVNKILILWIMLTVSVLITINYYFDLHVNFVSPQPFVVKFAWLYALFLVVFAGTWYITWRTTGIPAPQQKQFYYLLFAAPAIYAMKMSILPKHVVSDSWLAGEYGRYTNIISQWPLRMITVMVMIALLSKATRRSRLLPGAHGARTRQWPYLGLVLCMVPLLLLVGSTPAFQEVYPRLNIISFLKPYDWWEPLLFEISYGLDFFTVELFFRGFLILAFIKYGGRDAILPMAVFYCTIHFGKPVAECISSFFGGLMLGAIVYNTRSIWGGLTLHLGLAWSMEIVGAWYE